MKKGDKDSRTGRSSEWPRALTTIAIVAMIIASGLYVFTSLRRLPGDAVDKTREVLGDLESVAAAFRQGTIKTSFIGYATEMSGSQRYQFATLKQTEVYTREDEASILWGRFALPEVVVTATAPVEYTYYLNLEEEWRLFLADGELQVTAPAIRFNMPAIDASEIRYEVRDSSLLRDEDEALEQLKRGLTQMSRLRAAENIDLVREVGRSRTREFVERWLVRDFADAQPVKVRVAFADELPKTEIRARE